MSLKTLTNVFILAAALAVGAGAKAHVHREHLGEEKERPHVICAADGLPGGMSVTQCLKDRELLLRASGRAPAAGAERAHAPGDGPLGGHAAGFGKGH